ncbi:hypothetical protein [Paraglaciecola sp. L3A3]|uniref:hypothetical protein n=1 Tax=Paraglaciecola sp. L3A3 TaxID=2686358 RepID=UPI00131A74D3|nr:hypothetical protein [Paraglaciecola sp. L3A3]
MKIDKAIALAAVFAASQPAVAGLISDYSLDTNTNIVIDSASGIEWLQWSVTDGLSIEQALAAHGANGWSLATNVEIAYLFNSFDLSYGTFEWGSDEDSGYNFYSPSDGFLENPYDRELVFVNFFGDTYNEFDALFCPPDVDCIQYSGALFGADENRNGWYNPVSVSDDYYHGVNWAEQSYEGISYIESEQYLVDQSAHYLGVALTRKANFTIIDVSEPSTISLFALILIGSSVRRYRKSHNT